MPTLAELAEMQPRDDVATQNRTEARDAAFAFIEELRASDDWPLHMTDIATRSQERDGDGWSRQHIANTIEHYYELPSGRALGKLQGSQIRIPDDVDNPADYLRGVADGLQLADRD